ncbi:uncharacterized protein LOC111078666 [Drosophila obscura]|uniref:uncharacterized protein LOC111078666 n=1 Tax=Drosophila obscura TaxID=7282 RepID=UPI001BB0D8A4|nr:uncharacterized protein LOC111078666 [Drosophila obscura]
MKERPDIARNLTKGDKVWKDWRLVIKRKIAHSRRETRATGGGPFKQMALTPTEEEIALLCNMFEAVDGVAGARTYGIMQCADEKENEEEPSPKRPRMDGASCSKEKATTDHRLAAMVADETLVLKEIKEELVELKKNAQEMLLERKTTNLILDKLVLAIETKFK